MTYPSFCCFFKHNKTKYLCFFISVIFITLFSFKLCQASSKFHGKRISGIHFEAEPFVDKKEMLWLLDFIDGDLYSEKLIQQGIKTIFLKSFFSDIIVEAKEINGKVELTFILIPKTKIKKIYFKGDDNFWKSELREIITIKENDEFFVKIIDESVLKLEKFYKSEGFFDVSVKYEVKKRENPYEREVVFNIVEGEYAVIESLNLSFPRIRFDEEEIMDVIGFEPGDRFSEEIIKEAQTNLEEYLIENDYYDVNNIKFVYKEELKVHLTVEIDIPYKVRINFTGNEMYSDKRLFSFFNFGKHKSSDIDVIKSFVSEIDSFYKGNGFYYAEITISDLDNLEVKDNEKIINIHINEGKRVIIDDIVFTGNTVYSGGRLAKQMLSRESGTFTNEYLVESVLADDITALEFIYQKNGYLDIAIEHEEIFSEDKSEVTLEIIIDEGEQTIISDIVFEGFSDEYLPEVKERIKSQTGNAINIYRLEDEKIAIANIYKKMGYYNVKVNVESRFLPGNKVRLTYVVKEGIKARIGRIIKSSNDFTKKKVIRREAGIERGDPYILSKIFMAQQKIYRLGYFDKVSIKTISDEDEERKDLIVEVKEKDSGAVEFGIGYATEEGVRGSIEVKHTNLYGYGRTASIRADADKDSRIYSFYFEEPWLFNNPYDATLYVVDQYLINESYSLRKFGTTFGIKKDFSETIQAILQYELEFDELIDVEDVAVVIPEDIGTNRICTISPYLVRDSRNDLFNPSRGSFNSFKFDYASREIGSELAFQKIVGRSSWYFPLRRNITLAASFRGGYGFSFGDEPKLPINKRFFLGGRSTVRGFTPDSIGPKGEGDVPIGGSIMTNYNTEFRISFGKSWGGIVFYDAGNVWSERSFFKPTDLRDAAGIGIRFITVAGPISLDVGQKLDREPGESLTEWYFTIGNIF